MVAATGAEGVVAAEPEDDAIGAVAEASDGGVALAVGALEALAEAEALGFAPAASAVGCCATTASTLASGSTKARTILP